MRVSGRSRAAPNRFEEIDVGRRLRLLGAARRLEAGGVVAYPTEAVFGLGCRPRSQMGLRRILAIKRRRATKGMILIGSRIEHLRPYLGRSKPGLDDIRLTSGEGRATTWVVPAAPGLPRLLTGGRRTVAVRLTRHPIAAALCDALGDAIVSTSANRSGTPALRYARTVRLRLGRELDAVVTGECGRDERPSRIVEIATGAVLRD
jgi:L-threonylcarbamoyladenylate synthase